MNFYFWIHFIITNVPNNLKLHNYLPGKAVGKTNVGVQTTCSGVEAIFSTL